MFSAIYIESEVAAHPLCRDILALFGGLPLIECNNYREIFNRANQNFRLQKSLPPLILAKKYGNWVLPAPAAYSIGGRYNYYFSHMLNCIYDCRYCFLQGMYRSAANVVFVNVEDMQQAIVDTLSQHPGQTCYFFSGYDCDSLALEPVTRFVQQILPLFAKHAHAVLELRSKSTQIRSLLKQAPLKNCVVAFSLSPATISDAYEHKAPSLEKRLDALVKLQDAGWPIGLRFDPLIYDKNYPLLYREFFRTVFRRLEVSTIHSVSLGSFRLPDPFFKKLLQLYPDDKLLTPAFTSDGRTTCYAHDLQAALQEFCQRELLNYIPASIYFPCFT